MLKNFKLFYLKVLGKNSWYSHGFGNLVLSAFLWIPVFAGMTISLAFAASDQQSPLDDKTNAPLIVVLDWFINPDHAPLFVAEQEHFFEQQGIRVKFIVPADSNEGVKMVAALRADVAVTYQPSLIYQVTQGFPLVRFATLINQPLDCLLVLKQSGIKTIEDLKGKTIGNADSADSGTSLKVMLASGGLKLSDVQIINVHFDLTQALLAGKIDGFTGAMRNFEPIQVALAGKKTRAFYPENYGYPSYDELILVTNRKQIHDPRLPKLVKALAQGVAYLQKHPQSSWQKFAANHPELNNELNKKVWFATYRYFATDPAKFDQARYQKLSNFMYQNKLIAYVPELAKYSRDN